MFKFSILLIILTTSPLSIADRLTGKALEKAKLEFYECVLEEMEKQQVPHTFPIAVKYCEILHPNGSGDI